jgi:hypothetical protein
MDAQQPATSRRRRIAVIASAGLGCVALAVPVSGALADSTGGNADSGAAATVQYGVPDGQAPEGAPDSAPRGAAPDGPCPEDQGAGGDSEGSGTSDAQSESATAL